MLNLCEKDSKENKKWGVDKDKFETLSRAKQENRPEIEKTFRQWQNKCNKKPVAQNLSSAFWEKETSALTEAEKEFLSYANASVSKTDWENHSQNDEMVERQKLKYDLNVEKKW